MENNTFSKTNILSASILFGLLFLGFFIFKGLKTFSDKDRVVAVKGLAEIDIPATSASISINFSFSGDVLQDVIQQTETKKNSIIDYLTKMGFSKKDLSVYGIDVEDKEAYYSTEWQEGKQVKVKIDRYKVTQTLRLNSKEINSTEEKADEIKFNLISKELTSTVNTSYSFPELNSVKPKLIAESTKNARIAGEQFANDSKASLGKIKTASQGQITIAGQYSDDEVGAETSNATAPYIQRARVVSTIVFFLE